MYNIKVYGVLFRMGTSVVCREKTMTVSPESLASSARVTVSPRPRHSRYRDSSARTVSPSIPPQSCFSTVQLTSPLLASVAYSDNNVIKTCVSCLLLMLSAFACDLS